MSCFIFYFKSAIGNGQYFSTLIILILFLFVTSVISGQPCEDDFSVDLTQGEYFSDGRVVFDGVTYTKDYVYSKNVSGDIKTFGCACEQRKCLRKCCPKGSVLNMTTKKCVEFDSLDIILKNGLDLYLHNRFQSHLSVGESEFGFLYGRPLKKVYLEHEKWYLQESCDPEDFIDISKGTYLPNGDLLFDGKTYTTKDYIITKDTGLKKACKGPEKIRIRKCCPFGRGTDVLENKCVNLSMPFDPPVLDEYYYTEIPNANVFRMFDFEFGKHNCTRPAFRILLSMANIPEPHILKDGQLYIELPMKIPPWTLQTPDKYCVDTFVYTDETGKQTTKLDALVCFAGESIDVVAYITTSVCMLISCVFILATVAVYGWLPELRNLHGRVLMAYLLCLFVSFIFLSTMKILLVIDKISGDMCVILTFLIYFFLLSSFFWLNVMSFDIWWTFSGKRGLSLEKLTINVRFGAYALYAFSIPIVLTIIMASLEFSGLQIHPLLPNIRHHGCFLYGKSRLLYLYGPMVVLCLANMTFFVLTATKIAQIKQQTSVLKSKESTTHDQHRKDQQRLFLYVKLFIVMGINWLLEVISSLYPAANGVWWITDAYNVLIGLTIFIIFVCKRKIFRLMKKRYRQLRGDPMSRTETATSRTVSSRDDNLRMSTRNSVNNGTNTEKIK